MTIPVIDTSCRTSRCLPPTAAKDSHQAAEYTALLARMDWQFEFAAYRQYQAGRDTLARLRVLQPQVDPSGDQWRAASGTSHGVPQPTPALLGSIHPALAGAFVGLLSTSVRGAA